MLNQALKKQFISMLAQVVADLKSGESGWFINDFFTPKELETYTKRLAAGYWLAKGRTVVNVTTNLKLSNQSVSQIKKMAATKGFRIALKKIEAEEWASKWAKRLKMV